MSKHDTVGKRILKGDVWHDDRGPIEALPDQWQPPMTEAERRMAARSDPDNPPLTKEQLSRLRRVAPVRRLRLRLGLTSAEFAERYAIPLDVLLAWERGATEPDATGRAYLAVIEHAPEVAREAQARISAQRAAADAPS